MKTYLLQHHLHSRGVSLLKVLSHALILLESLPLSPARSITRRYVLENLEQLILPIASLCAEDESWESTKAILHQAGLDVPDGGTLPSERVFYG